MSEYPEKPEEGVIFPETAVTSRCGLPSMGAKNQEVSCKSSKHSYPLSYHHSLCYLLFIIISNVILKTWREVGKCVIVTSLVAVTK